jgi:type IV secretory pathway VirB6-like protein
MMKLTISKFFCCALIIGTSMIVAGNASAQSYPSDTKIIFSDQCNTIVIGASIPTGNSDSSNSGTADKNCTSKNDTNTDTTSGSSKNGTLSEIEMYLKQLVDEAMVKLYNSITGDGRFIQIVSGALTLFIIIFGIAFLIGMLQLSYGQVLVRIFKIAIIVAVTSPMGWSFFNDTAVKFFRGGSDDIIRYVISQTNGTGGGGSAGSGGAGSPVFTELDKIASGVLNPNTVAKLLAAVTTGPYGAAMGGLMMIATVGFISLLVHALKTYAISYVARALLFGLAPIFIIFLLFERTKGYFTTWLNAVLNYSLQPVLLFIMLAFMMSLIDQAAKDMLSTEVCWAEFQGIEGSSNKTPLWRFAKNGQVDPSEYTWQGPVSCQLGGGGGGTGGGDCKPYPIDIVDILSFVFLVFLATRFAKAIEPITAQLTNIYLGIDPGNRASQIFDKMNKAGSKVFDGANTPKTPTPPS